MKVIPEKVIPENVIPEKKKDTKQINKQTQIQKRKKKYKSKLKNNNKRRWIRDKISNHTGNKSKWNNKIKAIIIITTKQQQKRKKSQVISPRLVLIIIRFIVIPVPKKIYLFYVQIPLMDSSVIYLFEDALTLILTNSLLVWH